MDKGAELGSMYSEKALKALFVEGDIHQIYKTLRGWWAEHQNASPEGMTQRANSLMDPEARLKQKETINAK